MRPSTPPNLPIFNIEVLINLHPNSWRKGSESELSSPPKRTGVSAFPQPIAHDPTKTEKGIPNWLKDTGKCLNSPVDFGNLQIAFAAAFPLANELPEWAWTEYQVIADNYSRLIRPGSRSFETAYAFQMMQ
ncbi:hypothetical protein Q9L58_010346 [Maublancomyces gigas]|uniref:Uncharacterized protein n=1 Tax=Discina gigas TaxID=1032678 RepID=A0ABR3G4C4_9PEZI